ncbi:hypothetical protein [Aquibacillus salsiterrae]|uniref:Tetratricopeptide repeat protein n=1 Tax=Aquibacillus salsiterrae TaxID=2950439 RepID=A0A9X3WEG8_9BACI|nr:hypothetical protein [Aquibacillus salsiterrae]MDC3415939.1 hypothetical protein [Aquibacillus salsiterrae]
MTSKLYSYLFLVFVGTVVMLLSFVFQEGQSQDEVLKEERELYLQAVKNIQNTEAIDETLLIFEYFTEKYPERYEIWRNQGLALAVKQNYQSSVDSFSNALELQPFLITDPVFDLQYANSLINSKVYDKSKVLLEVAQESGGLPQKYEENVDKLMKEIEENTGDQDD